VLAAAPAWAAGTTLTIEGFDPIEVLEFSWGMEQPDGQRVVQGELVRLTPKFSEPLVAKRLDVNSAKLSEWCATGRRPREAKLQIWSNIEGVPIGEVEMSDVIISSSYLKHDDRNEFVEWIGLRSRQIEWQIKGGQGHWA
jgi:type VI protein secretion system component Hcp